MWPIAASTASTRSASDVIARSGATKQPPRSWWVLRYAHNDRGSARNDMDARRVNLNLLCSDRKSRGIQHQLSNHLP
jgi:hypothetical protein